MKKTLPLIVSVFVMLLTSCEPIVVNKPTAGPYLGESPPDTTPKIFAPYLVSSGLYTRDLTMTPMGDEIFFSVSTRGYDFIMTTKLEGGIWQQSKIAQFSGSELWKDYEPHISPKGDVLMFLSTRPQEGQEPRSGWHYQNIWAMHKKSNGWSTPYCLPEPINSDKGEFYPSLTLDGTLYFTRSGKKEMGIFKSQYKDSTYTLPERIRFKNDNKLMIYNAYIAPKEDYILACVKGLPHTKQAVYCVAFKQEDNTWSELYPFNESINKEGSSATSISLSPKGKYVFFASSQVNLKKPAIKPGYTLDQLIQINSKPGNGSSDIYWVSAKVIDQVRRTNIDTLKLMTSPKN